MASRAPIRVRQIGDADLDDVADLLTRGFWMSQRRSRDFWICGLRRLAGRGCPSEFPRYGYLLESNGTLAGVVLLIFSSIFVNGETKVRCNLSSIYIEPEFRVYGGMLHARLGTHEHVTYSNISADPRLWPILEAQGFTVYCKGRLVTVPALTSYRERTHIEVVTADLCVGDGLEPFEIDVLTSHAKYGCISVTCNAANRRHPFVFRPLRGRRQIPKAYLVYCRNLNEFVRFAGPLGRYLVRRGIGAVVLDSDGPIEGLVGRYYDNRQYFKGPDKPRLGDIAFSEWFIFDF